MLPWKFDNRQKSFRSPLRSRTLSQLPFHPRFHPSRAVLLETHKKSIKSRFCLLHFLLRCFACDMEFRMDSRAPRLFPGFGVLSKQLFCGATRQPHEQINHISPPSHTRASDILVLARLGTSFFVLCHVLLRCGAAKFHIQAVTA